MKETAVRFINMMHLLYSEHPSECAEVDALLSHIYARNAERVPVCITDLVRANRFGTLPTLSRRLHDMERRGLIAVRTGSDRRTRLIELAQGGLDLLETRAELLAKAAAGRVLVRGNEAA
jgi:hypothetical protein